MRIGNFQQSYAELTRLMPHRVDWAWYGLLATVLIVLPLLLPAYLLGWATLALIAITGAVGLNIVTGTAGLISLGHAGFLAVGAYTTAILTTDHGWGIIPAMLAAGVIAASASLLVGIPSLRLKGLYLAITTLAFSIIVTTLISEATPLTGGAAGKSVTRPTLYGLSLDSGTAVYHIALATAFLSVLATLNLMRCRVGRAWSAIRDYDIAASLMGVNLRLYKLSAFAVSAFLAGLSGSVLALHLRHLSIDSFDLLTSVEVLTMIVVGGLGSVRGAVLGAIVITLLPELARIILDLFGGPLRTLSASNAPELKGVLYAIVIMAFLRYEPDGIASRWHVIKRYWSDWPYARRRGR